MITATIYLRACLGLCLISMALIAALFLRRRVLTWWEFLAWGMLILLVPILGPFLTILSRPGSPRHLPSKPHLSP